MIWSFLTSKLGIGTIILLVVFSSGYFGWNYIEGLNQDKLDLALSLSKTSTELNYSIASGIQKEQITGAYVELATDTVKQLNDMKAYNNILQGQLNEIEFVKNFGQWAEKDIIRLNDCMQLTINSLFNHAEKASRGESNTRKDNLPCSGKARVSESREVISSSN